MNAPDLQTQTALNLYNSGLHNLLTRKDMQRITSRQFLERQSHEQAMKSGQVDAAYGFNTSNAQTYQQYAPQSAPRGVQELSGFDPNQMPQTPAGLRNIPRKGEMASADGMDVYGGNDPDLVNKRPAEGYGYVGGKKADGTSSYVNVTPEGMYTGSASISRPEDMGIQPNTPAAAPAAAPASFKNPLKGSVFESLLGGPTMSMGGNFPKPENPAPAPAWWSKERSGEANQQAVIDFVKGGVSGITNPLSPSNWTSHGPTTMGIPEGLSYTPSTNAVSPKVPVQSYNIMEASGGQSVPKSPVKRLNAAAIAQQFLPKNVSIDKNQLATRSFADNPLYGELMNEPSINITVPIQPRETGQQQNIASTAQVNPVAEAPSTETEQQVPMVTIPQSRGNQYAPQAGNYNYQPYKTPDPFTQATASEQMAQGNLLKMHEINSKYQLEYQKANETSLRNNAKDYVDRAVKASQIGLNQAKTLETALSNAWSAENPEGLVTIEGKQFARIRTGAKTWAVKEIKPDLTPQERTMSLWQEQMKSLQKHRDANNKPDAEAVFYSLNHGALGTDAFNYWWDENKPKSPTFNPKDAKEGDVKGFPDGKGGLADWKFNGKKWIKL